MSPAVFTALFALATTASADPKHALERDLISLAADAQVFLEATRPNPRHLHPGDRLLEAARSEVGLGRDQEAQALFLEAAKLARDNTRLVPAVEGYVAATARLDTPSELPPLERYVTALRYSGALDVVAEETLYTLGKVLARHADARALDVLSHIDLQGPRGRRALYVAGTLHLRTGDKERAQAMFEQAIATPPDATASEDEDERERDIAVYEHALLAVGRLAFDAGDVATGAYAYQRIPTTSPRFHESLSELGWLAMTANDETTAFLAFHALVQTAPEAALRREAQLLKGYVLLREGKHQEAEAHYAALSTALTASRRELEQKVSRLEDPTDLARDCETRRAALKDPLLADILARPEMNAATRLARTYGELVAFVPHLREQAALVERILTRRGDDNPLVLLTAQRHEAESLLTRTQDLLRRYETTSLRAQWKSQASGQETAQPCCLEPRGRLAHIQRQVAAQAEILVERERAMLAELTALQQSLSSEAARFEHEANELSPVIAETQRELVLQAVQGAVAELTRLTVESDAGVLEATWRYKEEQRDEMAELERQRKAVMQVLDVDHAPSDDEDLP